MPSSAALVDNFDDNSLDVAKWTQTNNAGVVGSETAQTYRFALLGAVVAFSDITSVESFDLTGSHHTVELVDAGVQQNGLEAYFTVRADANNRLFIVVANGFLGVYKVVAGTQTSLTFPAYDPVAHRWLRIRESSGTTFWEASANGASWSALHSEANPIPVTSVQLVLQAGAWQQLGSAKTVIYDNVGGLSAQSGAAALSASGTLAAVATAAVSGAASLNATTTLTVTGAVTAVASAALTADGTLTASGTGRSFAAAALSAESGLTAAGSATSFGSASFAAEGALTAAGEIPLAIIDRPFSGTTSRPFSAAVERPDAAGETARPLTGTTARP